jgi:hypothetical protein
MFCAARPDVRFCRLLIVRFSPPRRATCRARRDPPFWLRRGRCFVGIRRSCAAGGGKMDANQAIRHYRSRSSSSCFEPARFAVYRWVVRCCRGCGLRSGCVGLPSLVSSCNRFFRRFDVSGRGLPGDIVDCPCRPSSGQAGPSSPLRSAPRFRLGGRRQARGSPAVAHPPQPAQPTPQSLPARRLGRQGRSDQLAVRLRLLGTAPPEDARSDRPRCTAPETPARIPRGTTTGATASAP